ncbi:MAG: hypothetical protein C1943_03865 [Halochromatium sp.]|nr:hypothetical protein [Halochromatium sp.]
MSYQTINFINLRQTAEAAGIAPALVSALIAAAQEDSRAALDQQHNKGLFQSSPAAVASPDSGWARAFGIDPDAKARDESE